MSLYIASLNSGSNGNCYYIGNENEAILVDAGISCREIEQRLKRLHLSVQKIKAVFISHEHRDHIKGLAVFSRKYHLPVYISPATRKEAKLKLDKDKVMPFQSLKSIAIGEILVTPFSKQHDAVDPYSFTVGCRNINVGVFTDIGTPSEQLIVHFKQCHAAFLESNYDEEMLEKGTYPYYLKTRIRGGMGHLSNRQALELFTIHRPVFMSHLLLSHLSKNNNSPQLVQELFEQHSKGVKIVVASRYEESAVYYIGDDSMESKIMKQAKSEQLVFSFGG
jgi:phosphoribosyl 1,2-cyclic phosphodiesterase